MNANKVEKKLRISSYDSVRCQIITELIFLQKLNIIPSDIEILTLLALWGPLELREFLSRAARQIYKDSRPEEMHIREQNVRNRLVKLGKRELVTKHKKDRNIVQINPELKISYQGNILLNYQFLSLESSPA